MTIPEDVREAMRQALEFCADDYFMTGDRYDHFEAALAWLEAQPEVPESEPMQMPDEVRGWIESAAKVASDSARYYDADSSSSDAVLAWLDAQPAAPEPDWTTAPDWAQWWAVSARGVASWWAGDKPYIDGALWDNGGGKLITYVIDLPLGVDWRTTLRRRPEVTAK
jgi:hypothetical protein